MFVFQHDQISPGRLPHFSGPTPVNLHSDLHFSALHTKTCVQGATRRTPAYPPLSVIRLMWG